MQKIVTIFSILLLSISLQAQYVVNLSGYVTHVDGTVADGVLLFIVDEMAMDSSNFIETITDSEGMYAVSIEVEENDAGGCLSVLMFDCDGSITNEQVCYDFSIVDINLDLIYCSNANSDCFGFIIPEINPDSSLTLTAEGIGPQPFTYSWSNGSTTQSINVPLNDTLYCVVITDNSGCSFETCFSYGPPPPCEVFISQFPTGAGVVLFAETWGAEPVEYLWSNGEDTPEINVAVDGYYCVSTTDAAGCMAVSCQTVVLDSIFGGQCFGYINSEYTSDSTLILTAEGWFVSDVLLYSWSTGDSTQSIEVTEYGTYCVTMVGVGGCVAEACYDYLLPEECGVWLSCDPTTSGVELFAWGWGADPIEYVWNTGETGEYINVQQNGEYCVTATDALGCIAIQCQNVVLDSIFGGPCVVFIDAGFNSDSAAILTAQGWFGTDIVEYNWSTGDTTPSITVEEDGTYCVTVIFADGCLAEACYEYFIPADCGVWFTCDPTGAGIQLFAIGWGAEPIEYVWSNGDVGQELIVAEDGEYCVTATDANGCEASHCQYVFINPPNDCWTFIEVIYNDSIDSATLIALPELPGDYEFIWNGDQTGPQITVTNPGVYCVEVLNLETGCIAFNCVEVLFGPQDCFGWIESNLTGSGMTQLSVFIIGQGPFTYVWSTGDSTSEIFVDMEGEYCVDISGMDGCSFTTCYYHIPGSIDTFGMSVISGYVFDSLDQSFFIEANVDLFQLTLSGQMEWYASTVTTEEGTFVFQGLPFGQYIAKAEALEDGTTVSYAPTYHLSTLFWEGADLLSTGDLVETWAPISMIRTTDVDGSGNISGSVTDGDNFHGGNSGEVRDGEPVSDINILLKFQGTLVGFDKTDTEGRFQFASLPMGVYEVIMERTGEGRKSIFVTLSPNASSISNIEFSTGTDVTLGTGDPDYLTDLNISPNPAVDNLVVSFGKRLDRPMTILVLDVNGRLIKEEQAFPTLGKTEYEIAVSDINQGVYMLTVTDGKNIKTIRFIKS